MDNKKVKDCSTCNWGKYNDYWNMPFCYNVEEECKNWDKWKEKVKNE